VVDDAGRLCVGPHRLQRYRGVRAAGGETAHRSRRRLEAMMRWKNGRQAQPWPILAPVLAFVALMVLWEKTVTVAQLPSPTHILSALGASHATLLDDTVATFWADAFRGYGLGW